MTNAPAKPEKQKDAEKRERAFLIRATPAIGFALAMDLRKPALIRSLTLTMRSLQEPS